MYLRLAFVCALLAVVACASAEDLAKCKSDGTAEGVKVAQEVCKSVLVSRSASERATQSQPHVLLVMHAVPVLTLFFA